MAYINRIAWVTIDTTGTVNNFGNLTASRKGLGASSDGTKAVFMGGEGSQTTMDYVTISTTANAQNWGYPSATYTFTAGSHSAGNGIISNGTRGVLAVGGSSSGSSYSDVIHYFTFATPANSTAFGELSQGRASPMQCSDKTTGVWAGGKYQSGGTSSVTRMDYLAIAVSTSPLSTASVFGDLSASRYAGMGGASDTGADRS